MPATPKMHWSHLNDQEMRAFLTHLDGMPESQRPVYGLVGRKPSTWEMIASVRTFSKHLLVLLYSDRVVVSTRQRGSGKEISRREWPLRDIASTKVVKGPMLSSVTFRFADGTRVKLLDVGHHAADPLERFPDQGVAAFARSALAPEALTGFFEAANRLLPLPEDLFKRSEAA